MAEENENNETPQSGANEQGGNDNVEFDAQSVVSGTVPEVKDRLDGLTADQLQQVKDAETDGQDRAGVHAAVDAALAKSDAGDPEEEGAKKVGFSTDEKVARIIALLEANGLSIPDELKD